MRSLIVKQFLLSPGFRFGDRLIYDVVNPGN